MPRLYVIYHRHDNPKYNTANKLLRLGVATRISFIPYAGVVLDPFSPQPISPSDRELVEKNGLIVIDASWRKIRRVLGKARGIRRRLPLLLAANPVNYGKPYLLSSAEALAAGLLVTGFDDYAERVLSLFKWGPEFIRLNNKFLSLYRTARNSNEILETECDIINSIIGYGIRDCEADVLYNIVRKIVMEYIDRGK